MNFLFCNYYRLPLWPRRVAEAVFAAAGSGRVGLLEELPAYLKPKA